MPGPTTRIARSLRQARVRRKVRGTAERPRLSVFRSGKHMYAQIITDAAGKTVLAVSTLTPELKAQLGKTATVDAAKEVGKLVARRCQEKGITRVVFDRGGNLYHGRVKAVADAARKAGLEF